MKITEIDLTNYNKGSKYKSQGRVWEVNEGHLIDQDGKSLTDAYHICGICAMNFEEVIEPVDYLTAYKDCLENGTEYIGVDEPPYYFRLQSMERLVNLCGSTDYSVSIRDRNGGNVILNCMWVKKEKENHV